VRSQHFVTIDSPHIVSQSGSDRQVERFFAYVFCLGFLNSGRARPANATNCRAWRIAKVVGLETEAQKGCRMTSLRLFETDRALIAEDARSHLFETPPRSERYRRSRWPYDISVVLHAIALVSVVNLAWYLTPRPPPAPPPPIQHFTSAFILPKSGIDDSRRRRSSKTQHSTHVPVASAATVAAAPAPPATREPPSDTSSIAVEMPSKSAFDPPIPAGDASLRGRRGDPSEAGLGSATVNVRGSPTAAIGPGGLGEGSIRNVRSGGSMFSVRPGFDDASGAGGGATPPRIQEPLPIPEYPADARTHRLQGVVVLEVMLDTFGKAHVRGVLSRALGFGIEEAARGAAERLMFTPARRGGRSVDAIVQVRVTFTLSDGVATAVTGGA
jgi:protein TonB